MCLQARECFSVAYIIAYVSTPCFVPILSRLWISLCSLLVFVDHVVLLNPQVNKITVDLWLYPSGPAEERSKGFVYFFRLGFHSCFCFIRHSALVLNASFYCYSFGVSWSCHLCSLSICCFKPPERPVKGFCPVKGLTTCFQLKLCPAPILGRPD